MAIQPQNRSLNPNQVAIPTHGGGGADSHNAQVAPPPAVPIPQNNLIDSSVEAGSQAGHAEFVDTATDFDDVSKYDQRVLIPDVNIYTGTGYSVGGSGGTYFPDPVGMTRPEKKDKKGLWILAGVVGLFAWSKWKK